MPAHRSPIDYAEAAKRVMNRGVRMCELARKYGVPLSTFADRLQKHGYVAGRAFKLTAPARRRIVNAVLAGEWPSDLARQYGVHPDTIRDVVNASGHSCAELRKTTYLIRRGMPR